MSSAPRVRLIRLTTSEMVSCPSLSKSPTLLGALVGGQSRGGGEGGGEGGEKGAEQIGGPVKICALFGGVHSRSGLSAVFLQKHTSSLKSR